MVATEEETMGPVVESVTTTPTPKEGKKFYGLSNFMPRVPSYILQKGIKEEPTREANGTDEAEHAGEHPADELRSLPELSAGSTLPPPPPPRRRGLSLEQNAFASSLVRKLSGFRASSASTEESSGGSPRNSQEGSLTGASSDASPRSELAMKVRRGACIATRYGTGTVLDYRADDGFYVVQLATKALGYMREDKIVREIKAIVGERVKTRWGMATVEQYYVDEDMYSIALDWRWDDEHVWRMKATTKKFEKISRSTILMQQTKTRLFEGYSSIRDSASSGYANVAANMAAKINTGAVNGYAMTSNSKTRQELGKAVTPFGLCSVLEVRADQTFVLRTPCGAIAYLQADLVKMLQRRTHFADGDRVKTPFGTGEIVRYRDVDEIYEVKMDLEMGPGSTPAMFYISDVHAESTMTMASTGAQYARISSIFNMTRNSVYTASASVKASASGSFNTLSTVRARVSSIATIKMAKAKFQKGERVITAFGSGYIQEVRLSEHVYKVQLRRLKSHGFFHEASLTAFPYERVTHFIVDGKTIPAPEMPKNTPEHKRRTIINEAIRQAREGK